MTVKKQDPGWLSTDEAFVLGAMCCFIVMAGFVGCGIGFLIRLVRH